MHRAPGLPTPPCFPRKVLADSWREGPGHLASALPSKRRQTCVSKIGRERPLWGLESHSQHRILLGFVLYVIRRQFRAGKAQRKPWIF